MAWWSRLSTGGKFAAAAAAAGLGYVAVRWYRNYKAAQAANAANASTAATSANAPVAAGTTGATSAGLGGGVLQPPTSGGNVFAGSTWTDPATGDTWYEISGAVEGGGSPGSLVGVWVDGTTGAVQYGSPPFTQPVTAPPTTSTTAAPPPPPPAPPAQTPAPPPAPSLPAVNSSEWPIHIAFGSYSPGEFTQIGVVNNGQYSGPEVGGGVPVYASDGFGGLYQGFSFSQVPNGTTIYIPSIYTGYEQAA